MDLTELTKKILNNTDSFDRFLRANFDFNNVKALHDDKVDYTLLRKFERYDFIAIPLNDCAEIQDFILISLTNCDEFNVKFEWDNITIYAYQMIDEMN